jgi:hypothetical protein
MLNPIYKPATLRAVGGPQSHGDVVYLALDYGNGTVDDALRLRLTVSDAEKIALGLLDAVAVQRYRASFLAHQSLISSGNPSADGSPQDGQSVAPLARSSSACCGEG